MLVLIINMIMLLKKTAPLENKATFSDKETYSENGSSLCINENSDPGISDLTLNKNPNNVNQKKLKAV